MAAPVVIQLTPYVAPPPVITPSRFHPPSARRLVRTPSLSTITDRRESGTSFEESRASSSSAEPSIRSSFRRARPVVVPRGPYSVSTSSLASSIVDEDDDYDDDEEEETHTASANSFNVPQPPPPPPPLPLPLPLLVVHQQPTPLPQLHLRPFPQQQQVREQPRHHERVVSRDPDIQADLDMYDQEHMADHNTAAPVTPTPTPSPVFSPVARPTQDQLRAAADLELLDQDAHRLRFGDLFATQQAIVVFIRHFWCPHCQDYMQDLVRAADLQALSATRTRLIIVSCGAPNMIRSYRQIFAMPPTTLLLTDPTRALYLALGMSRRATDTGPDPTTRSDYVRHGYWPGIGMVVKNAIKFRMPLTANGGDVKQLGGEFVLGPGLACSFARRMETTRSHTNVDVLLRAAGVEPRPLPAARYHAGDIASSAQPEASEATVDSEGKKRVRAVRSLPAKALRGGGSGNAPLRLVDRKQPPSAWGPSQELSTSSSTGSTKSRPQKKSSWSNLRDKFAQIAAATTSYNPPRSQADEAALAISSAPEPGPSNRKREREWAREQMQGPSLWTPTGTGEDADARQLSEREKQRQQTMQPSKRGKQKDLLRSKSVGDNLRLGGSSSIWSLRRRPSVTPQHKNSVPAVPPIPQHPRRFGSWTFFGGGSVRRDANASASSANSAKPEAEAAQISSAPIPSTRKNKSPDHQRGRGHAQNAVLPAAAGQDAQSLNDRDHDRTRRLSDPGPAFVAQWLAEVVRASAIDNSEEADNISLSDEYGTVLEKPTDEMSR
ncbi:hypothetical protein BKA62DRAFT_286677 [Auriculariales sp. MPI-PUGE-AT-0066]|nr:hypothetical protein BKA62DRAFT_286677 [Auriculariales sp. MPI-PUGE-AT-0066]